MSDLTIHELRVQIADIKSHGMDYSLEKQLLATMLREEKMREAAKEALWELKNNHGVISSHATRLIEACSEYSGVENKD